MLRCVAFDVALDVLEEAAAREKAARDKFAKEAELQASMRKNPWAELWYAAEEGDLKRLQELLNTDGCDVNARDAAGESALMKADRAGHEEATLLLLKGGASVTDLPTESWDFTHVVEWFEQNFPFAATYRAGCKCSTYGGDLFHLETRRVADRHVCSRPCVQGRRHS